MTRTRRRAPTAAARRARLCPPSKPKPPAACFAPQVAGWDLWIVGDGAGGFEWRKRREPLDMIEVRHSATNLGRISPAEPRRRRRLRCRRGACVP